jgi:hypothetical protein
LYARSDRFFRTIGARLAICRKMRQFSSGSDGDAARVEGASPRLATDSRKY